MEQLATAARPLRIAIIGAGPAGLYAAETLLKQRNLVLTIAGSHATMVLAHLDAENRSTPRGLLRPSDTPVLRLA